MFTTTKFWDRYVASQYTQSGTVVSIVNGTAVPWVKQGELRQRLIGCLVSNDRKAVIRNKHGINWIRSLKYRHPIGGCHDRIDLIDVDRGVLDHTASRTASAMLVIRQRHPRNYLGMVH